MQLKVAFDMIMSNGSEEDWKTNENCRSSNILVTNHLHLRIFFNYCTRISTVKKRFSQYICWLRSRYTCIISVKNSGNIKNINTILDQIYSYVRQFLNDNLRAQCVNNMVWLTGLIAHFRICCDLSRTFIGLRTFL